MKPTRYTGTFTSADGKRSYTLSVDCMGFIEAFFLLTADAIRSGKYYQLSVIIDEYGQKRNIGDISEVLKLINP